MNCYWLNFITMVYLLAISFFHSYTLNRSQCVQLTILFLCYLFMVYCLTFLRIPFLFSYTFTDYQHHCRYRRIFTYYLNTTKSFYMNTSSSRCLMFQFSIFYPLYPHSWFTCQSFLIF